MVGRVTSALGKLPLMRSQIDASHHVQMALTSKEFGAKSVRKIAKCAKMVHHVTSAPGKLPLMRRHKNASFLALEPLTHQEISAYNVR